MFGYVGILIFWYLGNRAFWCLGILVVVWLGVLLCGDLCFRVFGYFDMLVFA